MTLVAGMRLFQTTYTARFNRRHRLSGHLFQGRYKAVVVDPEARGYSATLSDYIHLNPVRARMIHLDERLFDYRWSSYPGYVARKERRPWLEVERVFGELGLRDDAAGRRHYAERKPLISVKPSVPQGISNRRNSANCIDASVSSIR